MEMLVLDGRILTHVLLPIFVVVFLSSMLRQKLHTLPKGNTKSDIEQVVINAIIQRSLGLRSVGSWLLPARSVYARKLLLTHKDANYVGLLWSAPESSPMKSLENFSKQDPSATFGAMKGQMIFVFLQGSMAYLINLLYSGFLVAKTPFSLPYKFKAMLQRGIDVPLLDVTYVSSLSWYFLVMLSLNGLMILLNAICADDADTSAQDVQTDNGAMQAFGMMNPGAQMMMPGMGAPDPKKLFAKERESLEFMEPSNVMEQMRILLAKEWGITTPINPLS